MLTAFHHKCSNQRTTPVRAERRQFRRLLSDPCSSAFLQELCASHASNVAAGLVAALWEATDAGLAAAVADAIGALCGAADFMAELFAGTALQVGWLPPCALLPDA